MIYVRKTLYSLMLDENVVREIDILAHRNSISRSALINKILAEYVDYTTPEQHISNIFSAIEELMMPSSEIVPFFVPNSQSMSLKSSLQYKYRPTVKYDVELQLNNTSSLGKISVLFRTQSIDLINSMTTFFKLWIDIEQRYLSTVLSKDIKYTLYDGKFERTLSVPDKNYNTTELAETISDYIKLFDNQMKSFLNATADYDSIERAYFNYIKDATIRI